MVMTAKKFEQYADPYCKTDEEIMSALEQRERLEKAVKAYLAWGPMTQSDRDLHEQSFRDAIAGNKPKRRCGKGLKKGRHKPDAE